MNLITPPQKLKVHALPSLCRRSRPSASSRHSPAPDHFAFVSFLRPPYLVSARNSVDVLRGAVFQKHGTPHSFNSEKKCINSVRNDQFHPAENPTININKYQNKWKTGLTKVSEINCFFIIFRYYKNKICCVYSFVFNS